LRGRGGAGYPFVDKIRAVRRHIDGGPIYLIANAYDADPGSPLSRALLTRNAGNVLAGIAIAARAVGATEAYLYLHPEAVEARAAAERVRAELVEQAHKEQAAMLARARQEIDAEKQAAISELGAAALENGAYAYHVKPVGATQLYLLVVNNLQRRSLEMTHRASLDRLEGMVAERAEPRVEAALREGGGREQGEQYARAHHHKALRRARRRRHRGR